MSPEVDELILVSRGGSPLSFSNCCLVYRHCNRLKSNKSDDYARTQLAHKPTPNATAMPLATSGDW